MKRKERKISRLKEYSYTTPNWYFVTICSFHHKNILGHCNDEKIILSEIGLFAEECWFEIPNHFTFVELDSFVVMPNHIHGIIILNDLKSISEQDIERKFSKPITGSLSTIIGTYKAAVTRKVNEGKSTREKIWQTRFYDHIIRDEKDLFNIRKYIENNPLKWQIDKYYKSDKGT